ncbi:MAG TPA: dienelactone hydrolase family protein [Chthoniobacterales bacterium]|nr:dienelactone hydrolase family protein [Chthoniobacterales bacterium]
MKGLLGWLAVFCLISTVSAQEVKDFGKDRLNSSPRHSDWIDLESKGQNFKAFVSYPERKDKAPVVIVVHEIFGLTDWVRSLCDELAEEGVIAIAPDLLSGKKFEDMDGARKATSALKDDQVQSALDAVADYALKKIPSANGHLAVCGFCWGGGWAFKYANLNPKLKAAFSFYGATPDTPEKVKNINAPVYGFYGELDSRISATIPKAEELMKAAGKTYEPVIYKGAGHGFMRSGDPGNPNPRPPDRTARDDAWTRWKTLLGNL